MARHPASLTPHKTHPFSLQHCVLRFSSLGCHIALLWCAKPSWGPNTHPVLGSFPQSSRVSQPGLRLYTPSQPSSAARSPIFSPPWPRPWAPGQEGASVSPFAPYSWDARSQVNVNSEKGPEGSGSLLCHF